ncbi:TMEM165/GDT1 family protein [Thermococcus nautili]|uniref:Uncharacterized protein n=1 Tax=Thermococcus nautili TaxID=195522 RepID=W8NVN7_9EURY|nr:TMEM165/GDT1 family protein [Thermococcus nautili]AHL23217.1 hypothetical protein BD01_1613 [Thermococcus nautili]CAI1493143.1 conserved protein of unknown function [Thermococcus nautili]
MENLIAVFVAIFLAELGDKTQLTTIAFASKYGWKTAFLGAILGLAAVNFIGALLGDAIGDVLPMELIHKGAGVLFIVFGVLMLLGKL